MKLRMHRWRRALGALSAMTVVGVAGYGAMGCGASDSQAYAPGGFDDGNSGPTKGADAGTGAGGGGSSGGGNSSADSSTPPPPEKEVESSFLSPVATGKYVWVANPKSGRVAFVDATTLAVKTVEAGNAPTYLAAVPDPTDDVTIVLNVGSSDATLLRATGAEIKSRNFKVHRGANAWSVSNDGKWAIAWTDAKQVKNPDPTDGFQDLTVIDLSGATPPKVLSVGYRPLSVGFAASGERAHAVTQDGVSLIALRGAEGPATTKLVALSSNASDDPKLRDVEVSPDGALALVRRDGRSDITVVSLDTEARTTVVLPDNVTDLDITDTGDRALAVVRASSQVAVLDVTKIATDPTAFSLVNVAGETIGSVSNAQGGGTALLYSNAALSDRMTVLNVGAGTFRVVRLYSPVLAAFPSPDAKHAVVLHDTVTQPSADAGVDSGTRSQKPGAFSLVPVEASLPAKIVGTDAPVISVTIAPTSDRAIVAQRDDVKKIYGAFLAKFPSLEVVTYPLASPPLATGIVGGARRAFIAQLHPEGRLTFIDLESGQARTLTGFELGSRVVEGNLP